MLESEERTARDMEPDIKMIDTYLYEMKDIDKAINLESSKLKGIGMHQILLLIIWEMIFHRCVLEKIQCKGGFIWRIMGNIVAISSC